MLSHLLDNQEENSDYMLGFKHYNLTNEEEEDDGYGARDEDNFNGIRWVLVAVFSCIIISIMT